MSFTSLYVVTAPPVGQHSVQQLQLLDPYHGHKEIAKLCAHVSQLFWCPEIPPLSAGAANPVLPILAQFIAYALHRTRPHVCIGFTALSLLQRLKTCFPVARSSSGHRLFTSAFIIASKVVCDNTYSNASRHSIIHGTFSLKQTNQMERKMCRYLEWYLNINVEGLEKFERKVHRDFGAAVASAHHRPLVSRYRNNEPIACFVQKLGNSPDSASDASHVDIAISNPFPDPAFCCRRTRHWSWPRRRASPRIAPSMTSRSSDSKPCVL